MQKVLSPDDTAKNIFDYLFMVKIPEFQSRSIAHIKMYGTYTTGNRAVDKTLSQNWLTTMLSIDGMIEYYKEGVMIRIVNYDDTKKIFEFVQDHLEAWANYLKNGINIGDAPRDDLILLDEFASKVYEHAKYVSRSTIVESMFARQLERIVPLNMNNFFNKTNEVTQKFDKDGNVINTAVEVDEREPMADYFKTKLHFL